MTNEEMLWYEQFKKWRKDSGLSQPEISSRTGVSKSSLNSYCAGEVRLENIHPRKRNALYELTGLDFFKVDISTDSPQIEMSALQDTPTHSRVSPSLSPSSPRIPSENIARTLQGTVDGLIDKEFADLPAVIRQSAGLLRAQRYAPSVDQRIAAISELYDALAEQLNYFAGASPDERKALTEALQNNAESFRYATNLGNVFSSGKGVDSWLAFSQPPSRIKKITQGGKK